MQIKPYDTNIQKLFQSSFFKIPRFQRPYSWDKGNVEEFWSDVIASGAKNYFVGSMVFYHEGNDNELFVVDGQQRLTTATVFLAGLRDAMLDCGEGDLAEGVQLLIERPDIKTAKKRFVLLTESSFPYLQSYIQTMGASQLKLQPTEEERGLKSAHEFAHQGFLGIVKSMKFGERPSKEQKAEIRLRLEKCRDAILSLDIIAVQLDNENDAHVVFETLNTRGRELETKDLVKNLVTKLVPAEHSELDPVKVRWDQIVKAVAGSSANLDPSTFLHHVWLSRFEYTPARTLYSKIKTYFTKENVIPFLTELEDDVGTYRRLFEPMDSDWEKEELPIRKSLQALSVFKMRQPTPFILAVLRSYEKGSITLKMAREAIGAVERFHFAHTAVAGQSSSGGVSMMYAAAGRDLMARGTQQKRADRLRELRDKLKQRLPDEATFLAGFGDIRFSQSETRQKALVRYALEEADLAVRQHLRLRSGAPVDYAAMTIEHLAPQNPSSKKAINGFDSIGNLLFVSEDSNISLKNKNFLEKKKILQKHNVPLDEVLAGATTWGSDEISARTEAIGKLLFARARR